MKKNRVTGMLAVVLLACFSLQAQTVGKWKSHMAYHNAMLVEKTPNFVFAVYDGSLLSYSPDDQSTQTFSFDDGLNDTDIKFLNYCPATNSLLIIYSNSNMDIFLGKNNVYNLPDIKNNIYLSNKIVNSVEIRGEYAYLSTGFGIVVVDLKRKEIKNTYRLDVNTMATCQWDDFMYAATTDGLFKAPLSSNLMDKQNWDKIPALSQGDVKNITKMVVFQDQLVFYDIRRVWRLAKDGTVNAVFSGFCKQLAVFNNQLIVGAYNLIEFRTDFTSNAWMMLDSEYQSITSESTNEYWVAGGSKGLLKIKINGDSGELTYEPVISGIQLNSPLRNLAFYMTFAQDKLLVTGGGRQGDRYHSPGTFMVYDNKKWYNLDAAAMQAKTGLECEDLMSSVVDPRDPNHYYVSSWGEGVYELQQTGDDLEFVNLYSYTNSSLQTINPDNPRYVRVDGMAFDRNNNLYIASSQVQKNLNVLSNTGKWTSNFYDDFSGKQPNQLIITRDNKKWVNLFRQNIGIFVLDDNGTPDNPGDDQTYFSDKFTDQENREIGSATYSCLAEDLNGTVWVGTDNGPITFSGAEQVQRGQCTRPTGVDQYGAGYYLLDGQKVMTIAVDGANRKWIGTWGGGVFVVDQSDGIKVENLNTSNSRILSDNIYSIAINGKTGEVFIATDRGICSYQSDAIEGKPNYSEVHAFPNPVLPNRNNQVVITGLMQNSVVKITDLNGNLMKQAVSTGGQYTWNCTNPKGEIVKSGIYLVFAVQPDGSQGVVTKIMVLK
jgi:hypothetical protein